jgi:hypothetical protein
VVNREEEEEVKKKMISLWKKQGKAGEGDWATELYWQDAEPLGASAPTDYSITASMCHSISHRAPSQAQSHASPFTYTGRRRGKAMMSGPLVNGSSQTAAPFQFSFIVLL